MPAIHLGGAGWTLVHLWPENQAHELWQQQLQPLMRAYLPCREILMQSPGGVLEDACVDWTHPGIGRANPPSWERLALKGRGGIVSTFHVGEHTVGFAAAGAARRGAAATSSHAVLTHTQSSSGSRFALAFDAPVRVCAETAALASLICLAVSAVLSDVAAHPVARDGRSAGTPAGDPDAAAAGVRGVLSGLDPFHAKVLELICSGWTNAEIAGTTRMSVSSVRAATSNLYSRLGVRNRQEAAAMCGAFVGQEPRRR